MTTHIKFASALFLAGSTVLAASSSACADRLDARIGDRLVRGVSRVEVTATDLDTNTEGPPAVRIVAPTGTPVRPGDPLSVEARGPRQTTSIFTGEVVGLEPGFDASGRPVLVVRALNKLHRLTRGKKSRTFESQTDADVARTIGKEHGLLVVADLDDDAKPDRITQHNQTDLEFLRVRAARLGYSVWVEDTTLYFARRERTAVLGLACGSGADVTLRSFHPRLSSADQVTKVTVRGWDPKKKEAIVGAASARPLLPGGGGATGAANEVALGEFAAATTAAQAHAVARAMLQELTAADIAAEIATDGDRRLQPGARVKVKLPWLPGSDDDDWEVVETLHSDSRDGPYVTALRVRRADRGFYSMPEVGDDVLVAFEHGDVSRPIVVGSLWNGKDQPPATACFRGGIR